MSGKLSPRDRQYIERLRAQISAARDLSDMPKWIEQNTKNPTDSDKPWTFKEHEYQVDIIKDISTELSMQKCSQVGATEMWLRVLLAMMGLWKNLTAIYILPNRTLFKNVSRGRVVPIVESSPALRNAVDRSNYSVEMRKIGSSFVYFSGSFGSSSAISIPAQALFMDELDFCNQTVLTTYYSRVGHSKVDEYLVRAYSTPTVYDYGINKRFKSGSMAYYTVKCPSCLDWSKLDYENNVEIPGFDGDLTLFDKDDLLDDNVKVDQAFFRCDSCTAPIPTAALLDPSKRKWVHSHPDKAHKSYQVFPQDVPAINPLGRTLRQIADYERKKDWWNFKIGVPFEDANSAFVEETLRAYATVSPAPYVPPFYQSGEASLFGEVAQGCVFGMDVGKTSWVTIGRGNESGGIDLIYSERVRQNGDNYAGLRALQLFRAFGCSSGVVDAAPDISLALFLTKQTEGKIWACQYVEKLGHTLETLRLKKDDGIVLAVRTAQIDGMASMLNRGRSRLCKSNPDFNMQIEHLKSLKRVEQRDDTGNAIEHWVSTGDDHYAHSALYCHLNLQISVPLAPVKGIIPFIPTVSTVKMKVYEGDGEEKDEHHFIDRLRNRLR